VELNLLLGQILSIPTSINLYQLSSYTQKKRLLILRYPLCLPFLISRVVIIISISLTFVPSLLFTETFAQQSPPSSSSSSTFSRQEINAGNHNAIQVNVSTHTQSKADYKGLLDNSSDIQRVTYSSNGKTLNTTLWLGSVVREKPSDYGASTLAYGMLIDADNNPTTGKFGVDYQKEIQWNNKTKNWNSFLVEYSSPEHFRTLELQKNYTGFFDKDQNYIPLPLDLKSITSPSKYRVLYYGTVTYNNNSKVVVDLTNWVDIPPPEFTFSTLPDPVILRQGEQKDIGIQLKSSAGVTTTVVDFIPAENYSKIKVEFDPDKADKSSLGDGGTPAPFRIVVPADAQVGKYIVPILVNISTGSIFPSKFINLPNFNLSVPTQGYISTKANLTISVLAPPSIEEQIKDFWTVYGPTISILIAGFAGAFSTYMFDHLKQRKKLKEET
jgi:hypothetical protein